MKVQSDSVRINPNPCNKQDEMANWQQVAENFIVIENILNGDEDAFTVMVSANDTTPDYLHGKFKDAATGNAGTEDFVIVAELVDASGDEHVKIYFDSSEATDYSASGIHLLGVEDGESKFISAASIVSAGGGSDTDEKVKCSSNDTTAGYLHAKFKDSFTYASQDFLVSADLVDDSGDENVRLAIDSSAITGYSASGDILLGLSDGVQTFFTAGTVSDTFKVKSTADDTTESFLHDAIEDNNEAYVSTEDGLVYAATDGASSTDQKERLFLNTSVIDSYSSIPDGEFWPLGIERSGDTRTLKFKDNIPTIAAYTASVGSAISAGSASTPASGSGTVYEWPGGSSLGTKDIKNPLAHAVKGNMTVTKIDDDTFLVAGPDILEVLGALTGFTTDKILYTDGTTPADIQWGGGEC